MFRERDEKCSSDSDYDENEALKVREEKKKKAETEKAAADQRALVVPASSAADASASSASAASAGGAGPPVQQKKKRGASEFFDRIWFLFHVRWVAFCALLWNWLHQVEPESQATSSASASSNSKQKKQAKVRKIVHIGDDFALGIGDWVTMFGIPGLLHYLHLQQPLLLSKWVPLNEGLRFSTSSDWLPLTLTHEINGSSTSSSVNLSSSSSSSSSAAGLLFENAFHPTTGSHINADIVMITLGSNDTCSASQTAENIMLICRELRHRLSRNAVVMVNIPPTPYVILQRPDDSAVKRRLLERNDALRAALLKTYLDDKYHHEQQQQKNKKKKKNDDDDESSAAASSSSSYDSSAPTLKTLLSQGSLRFGVDFQYLFQKQESVYSYSGMFLKPRGYREAARQLEDAVLFAQKHVESEVLAHMMMGPVRK